MHFFLSLLATLCCLFQLQSFVLPALASHVDPRRQSEFVDVPWSGQLHEPYLVARVSQITNSHVLCHRRNGPLSWVFSHGPSGATYGMARMNVSHTSEEAAAAYGEQLPSLSARYQRTRKAKTTGKFKIAVVDVEMAKRVNPKSPVLFTSAEYGRACL